MVVVLYTKDNCPQCRASKRMLDKLDIEYSEADAVANAAELRDAGFHAAPVIEVDGVKEWGGYRPDRIKELSLR